MLPRILQYLYRGCGIAAAAAICLMATSIVAEIVVRSFNKTLPGVLEIATFCLVAASFLSLAHTFRHNVHIRITVITLRMPDRIRRPFEMFALLVAGGTSAWLTYYTAFMAWDAYEFNDRSDGLLSIPLWIPQSLMTLGVSLLSVSIFEEFVRMCRGQQPIYEQRHQAALDAIDGNVGADR